jgi:ribosome-interacting GTPase 1
MSDEQQRRDAEQRRRFGLPQGVDLHNFDPRKAMDPNSLDKILRAQAIARAEAQAATTVIIATIVSLVTSAFSFVAALAWNNAIQLALDTYVTTNSGLAKVIGPVGVKVFYALVVTLIAIVVILIVNRFAGSIAKKSAVALASGN